MSATSKNGDTWTGEQPEEGWWPYIDQNGNRYESREVPVFRIIMNNATQICDAKGKLSITPINPTHETTT